MQVVDKLIDCVGDAYTNEDGDVTGFDILCAVSTHRPAVRRAFIDNLCRYLPVPLYKPGQRVPCFTNLWRFIVGLPGVDEAMLMAWDDTASQISSPAI